MKPSFSTDDEPTSSTDHRSPITDDDKVALSSQVTAWKVRDTFEQRAARGKPEDLAEILTNVPDVPPAPGDERE
jgi:hypothetical protein